jgi:chromosome segregation ATPase
MLVALVVIAVLAGLCASDADARGGGKKKSNNKGNKSAGPNKAAEQPLRAEIMTARGLLLEAESRIAAAKSQIDEAKKKNTEGKSAIDEAEKESNSADQKVHEIESQLLEGQDPASKVGKAKTQVDAARKALDQYRSDQGIVAGEVSDDPEYETFKSAAKDAAREYERLKTAMFESSAEWTAATEAAKAASEKETAAKEQAGPGIGSAYKDLKKAQKYAAAAHATIVMDEARLRAMGVSIDAPSKKKK